MLYAVYICTLLIDSTLNHLKSPFFDIIFIYLYAYIYIWFKPLERFELCCVYNSGCNLVRPLYVSLVSTKDATNNSCQIGFAQLMCHLSPAVFFKYFIQFPINNTKPTNIFFPDMATKFLRRCCIESSIGRVSFFLWEENTVVIWNERRKKKQTTALWITCRDLLLTAHTHNECATVSRCPIRISYNT